MGVPSVPRPLTYLTLIQAGVLAAVVLAPSVAQAAAVGVGSDGILRYTAGKGERNSPQLSYDGDSYLVQDSAQLTPGAACTPVPHGVECKGGAVKAIVAELGDGNDSAEVAASADRASPPYTWIHIRVPLTFRGGSGQDALIGDGNVAKSPDTDGPRGPERLEGGPDLDLLSSGVVARDVLLGGGGSDELDGAPLDHGEASHAKLLGGPGGDSLNPRGHDVAHGGRSPDYLDSTQASFGEKLYGDAGDDSFRTCSHHSDRAFGGRGHDISLDQPDPSDVLRSIIHPEPGPCR
jgi:hypothetical protein